MEELRKSESIQGWLNKKLARFNEYRAVARNHLKFLDTNPSYQDYVSKVKGELEESSRPLEEYLNTIIIIHEDPVNYFSAHMGAWGEIKKHGREHGKEEYLSDYLPDEFYEEVERAIPICEELLKLMKPSIPGISKECFPKISRENYPKFKEVSRQFAKKMFELMDKEEKIYRSLPEETLRKVREQEE